MLSRASTPAIDELAGPGRFSAVATTVARRRSVQQRSILTAAAGVAVELLLFILIIVTVLFFLLRLTGDPAQALAGMDASPEQLESVRRHYGLDEPLAAQYGQFLTNAIRLDFGQSLMSGEPALGTVLERVPATVELATWALLITAVGATSTGAFLAQPRRTWVGRLGRELAGGSISVLQGIPGFVTGLVLIQVFSVWLGWLPSVGAGGWRHAVLPASTLAAFFMPKLARVVAVNLQSALAAPYVRTARSLGAGRRRALWRHALPNAGVSAIALLGTQVSYMIAAGVVVEVIFSWPGLGSQLVQAVRQLDFPLVQATVVVIATLVFAANRLTALVVAAIDPRTGHDGVR